MDRDAMRASGCAAIRRCLADAAGAGRAGLRRARVAAALRARREAGREAAPGDGDHQRRARRARSTPADHRLVARARRRGRDSTTRLRRAAAGPWVAIESRQITVAPGGKYRYRFEVSPPADAPAGECRFAIMIEGDEQNVQTPGGPSFPIAGRLGVIVYVHGRRRAPRARGHRHEGRARERRAHAGDHREEHRQRARPPHGLPLGHRRLGQEARVHALDAADPRRGDARHLARRSTATRTRR